MLRKWSCSIHHNGPLSAIRLMFRLGHPDDLAGEREEERLAHSPFHLRGCLYVLEGACLGGQIIARALRGRLPLTNDHGLSFFVGDGSRTGARWKLVLGWLEDLVRRGALAEEIVASARETFCSLGCWVELMGA